MKVSPQEYNEITNRPAIKRRNPDCGSSPDTKLEPASRNDPLATPQVKGANPPKFLVRVTSYRTRLLDEDNLAEKYHIDTCRYAGLLPSDAPGKAQIKTSQKKVGSKAEERTEIEITPIQEGD